LNWLAYLLGFTAAAGAMLLIAYGIKRFCRKKAAIR
jgi:hypothetical protein